MFSGQPHPQATELLSSSAMSRLLRRLMSAYPGKLILFDSPPLLVTTESAALAAHVGQALLVVQANKTSSSDTRSALGILQNYNDLTVSLVLNRLARKSSSKPGANGYGYGYGYGGS